VCLSCNDGDRGDRHFGQRVSCPPGQIPCEADGIVVINGQTPRGFPRPMRKRLMKMIVLGMGKQKGRICHELGFGRWLKTFSPSSSRSGKANILRVGILEKPTMNARLEVLAGEEIRTANPCCCRGWRLYPGYIWIVSTS